MRCEAKIFLEELISMDESSLRVESQSLDPTLSKCKPSDGMMMHLRAV
jgi:hypothetical protein